MNNEIDIIQSLIEQGFSIKAPQQGINQVPQGLIEAKSLKLDPNKTSYFVQIYDTKEKNGKTEILIFCEPNSIELVERWRLSLIDQTKYELQLTVRAVALEGEGYETDLPISMAIDTKEIAEDLAKTFGCKTSFDGRVHEVFQIIFRTQNKSLDENIHIHEISKFERNIQNYLTTYSVLNRIGFYFEHRNILKPETNYTSGPWTMRCSKPSNEFENIYGELNSGENNKLSEIAYIFSTYNSQLSARAKIIIGHSFLENYFANSNLNSQAFEIKRSQKDSLAKQLYFSAKNISEEMGLDLEIKQDIFEREVKSFFSRKKLSKKEILKSEIAILIPDCSDISGKIDSLYKIRNNYSHSFKSQQSRELTQALCGFLNEVFDVLLKNQLNNFSSNNLLT